MDNQVPTNHRQTMTTTNHRQTMTTTNHRQTMTTTNHRQTMTTTNSNNWQQKNVIQVNTMMRLWKDV
jgi:hypothetical protein